MHKRTQRGARPRARPANANQLKSERRTAIKHAHSLFCGRQANTAHTHRRNANGTMALWEWVRLIGGLCAVAAVSIAFAITCNSLYSVYRTPCACVCVAERENSNWIFVGVTRRSKKYNSEVQLKIVMSTSKVMTTFRLSFSSPVHFISIHKSALIKWRWRGCCRPLKANKMRPHFRLSFDIKSMIRTELGMKTLHSRWMMHTNDHRFESYFVRSIWPPNKFSTCWIKIRRSFPFVFGFTWIRTAQLICKWIFKYDRGFSTPFPIRTTSQHLRPIDVVQKNIFSLLFGCCHKRKWNGQTTTRTPTKNE